MHSLRYTQIHTQAQTAIHKLHTAPVLHACFYKSKAAFSYISSSNSCDEKEAAFTSSALPIVLFRALIDKVSNEFLKWISPHDLLNTGLD